VCAAVASAVIDHLIQDSDSNPMIPEPDYNEDDHPGHFNGNNRPSRDNDNNNENANHSVTMDEDGLVIPRKPINPTKESIEYRAMHRELKFCQKSGQSPLNQKSELTKHLQNITINRNRKEKEKERTSNTTTELGKTLEQRARRLEQLEKGQDVSQSPGEPNEFLRMHAKLRGRVERASAL